MESHDIHVCTAAASNYLGIDHTFIPGRKELIFGDIQDDIGGNAPIKSDCSISICLPSAADSMSSTLEMIALLLLHYTQVDFILYITIVHVMLLD